MGGNSLSFSTLLGQEQAKQVWKRIVTSDRLGHAYLFRGPDGVGKRLCARLVAARLNCLQPAGWEACGACLSCRKFLSGNHPDFSVISPEGVGIKIDRIREVCRSLSYPPYESSIRVVVLEDVHTMRSEAANSLLKTLEEPPAQNLLILTAEASQALLPTILSRCQLIPFYGLSDDQVRDLLRMRLPELGEEQVAALAAVADGSPGRALTINETDILAIWREVQVVLGDAGATVSASVSAVLQTAERIAALKEHTPLLLGLLRRRVRDDLANQDRRLGGGEFERLRARLAAIDHAERCLSRNCNRTLTAEVLLFDLQPSAPQVSLQVRQL